MKSITKSMVDKSFKNYNNCMDKKCAEEEKVNDISAQICMKKNCVKERNRYYLTLKKHQIDKFKRMNRDLKKNINPLKKCKTKKCAKEIKLLKDDKELMKKTCMKKGSVGMCFLIHNSSDARKKIKKNLEKCTMKQCQKEHKIAHKTANKHFGEDYYLEDEFQTLRN